MWSPPNLPIDESDPLVSLIRGHSPLQPEECAAVWEECCKYATAKPEVRDWENLPTNYLKKLAVFSIKQGSVGVAIELLAYALLGEGEKSEKARGDLAAAACAVTDLLNQSAKKDYANFADIAEKRVDWPVIHSQNTSINADNRRSFEALKVGKKANGQSVKIFEKDGTPYALHTLSERLWSLAQAAFLISRCDERDRCDEEKDQWQHAALFLEHPTQENWESWFDVGWGAFLAAVDGKPENLPWLAQFGNYRKNHRIRRDGRPVGEATVASNIRDGIKRCSRAAFKQRFPFPKQREKN